MVGTVTVGRDGTIELKEKDGIEFAPATVKVRRGAARHHTARRR